MKRKDEDIDDLLNRFFPKIPKERVDAARNETFEAIKQALQGQDTSSWELNIKTWKGRSLDQEEFELLSAMMLVNGPRDPDDITTAAEVWNPRMGPSRWPKLTGLERKGFVKEVPGAKPGLHLFEVTADGRIAIERACAEGMVLGARRAGAPLKDGVPEKPKS
jgi:hypothetical protein